MKSYDVIKPTPTTIDNHIMLSFYELNIWIINIIYNINNTNQ